MAKRGRPANPLNKRISVDALIRIANLTPKQENTLFRALRVAGSGVPLNGPGRPRYDTSRVRIGTFAAVLRKSKVGGVKSVLAVNI